MKFVVKIKSGPFGKWKTHKVIPIGPDCTSGVFIKNTPAKNALKLENRLNGGVTIYEAEGIYARTGQHSAPIYRVDTIRENGSRIN